MEASAGEAFDRALADFGGDGSLDIGCALHDGAFEVDGENGRLTRSDVDHALIFFLVSLLRRLQKMASLPGHRVCGIRSRDRIPMSLRGGYVDGGTPSPRRASCDAPFVLEVARVGFAGPE